VQGGSDLIFVKDGAASTLTQPGKLLRVFPREPREVVEAELQIHTSQGSVENSLVSTIKLLIFFWPLATSPVLAAEKPMCPACRLDRFAERF
jgi:hypothetical protein